MNKLAFIITLMVAFTSLNAQDNFITKSGYVSFFSTTPIEDIRSENFKVVSRINIITGDLVFSIPIQSFEFEKALMQKDFNSKDFMDSKSYPKAKFKGRILDIDQIDLNGDGTYEVEVKGDLFIHGVEKKDFITKATLKVKNSKIEGYSKFNIRVADFNIEMPAKKKDNLAEYIEVELKLIFDSASA